MSTEYALEAENLCKDYGAFKLDNVSFKLPKGYVMGFVGRNGAGKSTTMKCLMRSVIPDSGTVRVFGEDVAQNEIALKSKIAFSSGTFESFPRAKGDDVARIYASFYESFDPEKFEQLKRSFRLDGKKRLKDMSAGQRVKFSAALALSHDASLFIFDEPTSGLDPVARDEMLDLFFEIIQDGEKSVLFSTHITSDLDKCADYLTVIDDGKVLLSGVKDEILSSHAVVSGAKISEDVKRVALGYKSNSLNFSALVKTEDLPLEGVQTRSVPNIEQLLVYAAKGGER